MGACYGGARGATGQGGREELEGGGDAGGQGEEDEEEEGLEGGGDHGFVGSSWGG